MVGHMTLVYARHRFYRYSCKAILTPAPLLLTTSSLSLGMTSPFRYQVGDTTEWTLHSKLYGCWWDGMGTTSITNAGQQGFNTRIGCREMNVLVYLRVTIFMPTQDHMLYFYDPYNMLRQAVQRTILHAHRQNMCACKE